MGRVSLVLVAIDCLRCVDTPCSQGASWERVWRAVYRMCGERLMVKWEWWAAWSCVAGRLASVPSFATAGGEYISGSSRSLRAWGQNTTPMSCRERVSHVMPPCARCR
jgi:hypothetical protein